jgi:hypothetical protein
MALAALWGLVGYASIKANGFWVGMARTGEWKAYGALALLAPFTVGGAIWAWRNWNR